jgi:galactose-1-phosphate uridylyltransferase
MNYLFPAGASLVHPHLQMLVTPVALSYQARVSGACRAWQGRNGTAYHADLIRAERDRAERYVQQEGAWHWMASFSPAGSNEIIAVHEREGDLARLSEQDLHDLASGISKVLAFYEELGHLSFNFTLFSERASSGENGFRCLVKIMNRQNVYPNYRNDDFFLQKVLQSEVIIITPEELASRLKGYFA